MALGLIAILAWNLFLHFTILRNRHVTPAPIWLVVVLGLLTGAIWGVVNFFGGPFVGLENPERPYMRTLIMALFSLWWSTGTTLFFEAREYFYLSRNEFIQKAVEIERLRLHAANIVSAMRRTVAVEIQTAVSSRLKSLSTQSDLLQSSSASERWTYLASHIRNTSDSAVRPLSHRLMMEKSLEYPKPSFLSVLVNIVRTQNFHPLTVATLYLIGRGPNDILAYGNVGGAIRIFLALTTILVVLSGANFLMDKHPDRRSRIFIATLIITSVTAVVFSLSKHYAIGGQAPVLTVVVALLGSVAIVLATSAFGSIRVTQSELLKNFESEIDQSRIELVARSQELAEIARENAQTLHGSVQSRLNSCALAIDEASKSGDLKQCREAFALALQTLAQPLDAAIISDGLTPEEVVHYVSEPWLGLCDIESKIDKLEGMSRKLPSKSLTYFLEEAVSNAVRHGNARSIFIHIEQLEPEFLTVKVLDDGRGLTSIKNEVLSPLLKELTNNTVKINNHQYGGAIVEAKFAYLQQAQVK